MLARQTLHLWIDLEVGERALRTRIDVASKRADAEIAAGKYKGPLHGIPWGVKDIYDTKGIRTTWGSPIYKDRIPARDSTVVARLQ